MVIRSSLCAGRLRVDKGCEFIAKQFQGDCLQTRVSLEYARSNTPQQIDISELFERTLTAMVRCMLVNSGLPKLIWEDLMFTAAFLENGTPHSSIGNQSRYEMLHETEPGLRFLRVTGARAIVHIKRYSKNLEINAVEGPLVEDGNNSKSYRVDNIAARRIMES